MNSRFTKRVRRRTSYQPSYDRNDGLPGVVYVLHNEAMRNGLYKIGQSTRSGAQRARDLNFTVGTETPKMFKCIFEEKTVDCGRAEKAVHERLKEHRLTKQEYFEVDLEYAKLVIIEECAKQVPAVQEKTVVRNSHFKLGPGTSAQYHTNERFIRDEISAKQAMWRLGVVKSKVADGKVEGLKWGVVWLVGFWLFFGMMGAKDSIGWLAVGVGIIAYFINKNGPAKAYLSSKEARDILARIENEVRQGAQSETANPIHDDKPLVPVQSIVPNQPDANAELKMALENKHQQALIGVRIGEITKLTLEDAIKVGLGTRLKMISGLLQNLKRAVLEKNICDMLQNSPPMKVSPNEALAICRLVENDLRLQWGWPLEIQPQNVLSTPFETQGGNDTHAGVARQIAPTSVPEARSNMGSSDFMMSLTPSKELAAIVGDEPLPRTEVIGKIWNYIKRQRLQDSHNPRLINADEKLMKIFEKNQVTLFEMAGLIGKHLR